MTKNLFRAGLTIRTNMAYHKKLFSVALALSANVMLMLLLVGFTRQGGGDANSIANTSSTFSQTLVVTSTADSGPGTLRQTLLDAQPGEAITFDSATFPLSSTASISLQSVLPIITQNALTIDASNAGVILDGALAAGHAAEVTIRGLQIYNPAPADQCALHWFRIPANRPGVSISLTLTTSTEISNTFIFHRLEKVALGLDGILGNAHVFGSRESEACPEPEIQEVCNLDRPADTDSQLQVNCHNDLQSIGALADPETQGGWYYLLGIEYPESENPGHVYHFDITLED